MALTACHSGSSGAWANNGPISSHARKRAMASSPSRAAEGPSFTPVRKQPLHGLGVMLGESLQARFDESNLQAADSHATMEDA